MIIEFVGAPGAGKSTLSLVTRQILRDLGLKGMVVSEAGRCCLQRATLGRMIYAVTPSKWQKRILGGIFRRLIVLYRLKFAILNRTLAWRVVSVLVRRPLSWRYRCKILHWFLRDASYHLFFRDRLRPDEALILQEGLVHRASSLYTSASQEPNLAEIEDYVKLLPRPDLVIWVQAPVDVCGARVRSRGIHRRYLGKDLPQFIAASARIIEIALKSVDKRGWDIIKINNGTIFEASETQLRDLLENRVGGMN